MCKGVTKAVILEKVQVALRSRVAGLGYCQIPQTEVLLFGVIMGAPTNKTPLTGLFEYELAKTAKKDRKDVEMRQRKFEEACGEHFVGKEDEVLCMIVKQRRRKEEAEVEKAKASILKKR